MGNAKMIHVDEEQRIWNCCQQGDPYMLIVQDGDIVRNAIKGDFDMKLVFQFIINFLEFKTDAKTKSALADFIIELSKNL